MRVRTLLAVVLAAVVVGSAGAGIVAADTTLSITSVSVPDSVTQGDSFELAVSVSGEELQNGEVDVSLTLPSAISCTPSGSQTVTLSSGTAQATFDCTAQVEGDYNGEITVSASGVSSGSGSDSSDTTQTGLEVISPASLTLSTGIDSTSISTGETTTLTAVINNAGDASTSYTLSLSSASGYSASLSSGSASGTVTGGATRTVEYTVTGDSTGDYTLDVSASAGNGQSLEESEALSVTTSDDDDDDDSDDADDADTDDDSDTDDGASGAVGTPQTPDQQPQTPGSVRASVAIESDGAVSASANASANDTVQVDLPANTSQAPGVHLERLNMSVNQPTAVQVRVSVSQQKPETVSAAGDDQDVAAYISVDEDEGGDAITGSEFTFSVNASTVSNPQNKSLYRHSNGTWNALPTTFLGKDNGTYRFRSHSPGFSVFAVRDDPTMPVVEAALSTSSAQDGDDIQIAATIENRGTVEGRRTVNLLVDGQAVDTQTVVIPAGESTAISFTRAFDAGDYEIAVDNRSAGALSVSAATTTQSTTTSEPTTAESTTSQPTTTTSTGFGPGFGPLAALLGVLLAALLVRQRTEE